MNAFFTTSEAVIQARQAVDDFRVQNDLRYGKKVDPEIDNQFSKLLSLYGKAQAAHAQAIAELPSWVTP